jgi:hypothetical protein
VNRPLRGPGAGFTVQPATGRLVAGVRARPRAPAGATASTEIARHLVLGYRPGWQSLEDLNAIARHVSDIEPTIRTFIVPTTIGNSVTRKAMAARPSLIVSPGRMPAFRPLRGKVYQGHPIPKIDELRRLAAAGVPVPLTTRLTPDLTLDPEKWGEFVIVKPTDIATSSHGLGIQLMRTHRVRYIAPEDYPPDHPGRRGPMIVQQFVDTGDRLTTYRVLTLFGVPLNAQLNTAAGRRVDLSAPDEVIESAPIALQATGTNRDMELASDNVMFALARAAHDAIPEIPLKGVDLLRDERTGKWYVIELNCGGNTWHFSSRYFAEFRQKYPEFEVSRRRQFDAMRTAARVLVARTLAEAE